MYPSSRKRLRLSKSLLQMKFMQRSKMKQMQEEDAEEGRAMYDNDITEGMKAGGDKFIIENSYVPLEGLLEGRFSFGGMSPHIERIMAEEEAARTGKRPSVDIPAAEMLAEVSAVDVAKSCLMNTMASKFLPKKERAKFKRPADDD